MILSRIAIAYCNLEFLGIQPDTPRASYIFNIGIIIINIFHIIIVIFYRGSNQAIVRAAPPLPPGVL